MDILTLSQRRQRCK